MDKKNKNFKNIMVKLKTWQKLMLNKRFVGYASLDEYINAIMEATSGFSRPQIEFMRQIKTPSLAPDEKTMYDTLKLNEKNNWHKIGESSDEDSEGES